MVENLLKEEGDKDDYSSVVAVPASLIFALDEKDGVVVDLAPYIHSQKFGMTDEQVGDFHPDFWNAVINADRQLGIPAQFSGMVMVYNTKWAGELGFGDPPVTPGEFKELACAANATFKKDADETNDGLGGWVVNRGAESVFAWLTAFGSTIYTDGAYTFDSAESEEALAYLRGLTQDSCAWVGRNPRTEEYFARRETIVYTTWLQDAENLAATMARAGSVDDWSIMPFPTTNDQLTLASNLVYSVLHTNDEKDLAAWLFIRWLSDPVQQARLLQTSGTYPLGTGVMTHMGDYTQTNPQWNDLVTSGYSIQLAPVNADWQAVRPVLEDGVWQLFNSENNPELIQAILNQMDDLAEELAERYP
jgi:ABC-type glycerol-3-phosphate transport system substrate-binding protein